MDLSPLLQNLLSTESPLLPNPVFARLYLGLSWGLVLALAGFWLSRRWPQPGRWALPMVLLLWSLWPGPASPAHWLGLAFQSPSLSSSLLCLGALGSLAGRRAPGPSRSLRLASWLAVALGWVLLLDTFALLPFGWYALGFSRAAVVLLALLALGLWLSSPAAGSLPAMLPAAVLLLYVLSRLPSGNLWDALLDPWLWLILQIGWLLRGLRWISAARRGAAATRA